MKIIADVFENAYYLHSLAAAAAAFILGFIWYLPRTFGNAWMRATGMTPAKASKANMPLIFGSSFALLYLMAVVLSGLGVSGAGTWQGAQYGLMYGGVFVLSNTLIHLMYAQRPLSLLLLEGGHDAAVLMLMGAVLGSFQVGIHLPIRLPF